MRKMILLLLLSLLLTVGFGSVAQAQDPASLVFCGTLDEADCNLLKQSATAMAGLSSASFDFNLQLSINSADTGPIDLGLNGVGSFTDAPTGLNASAMSNPAALVESLPGLLRQFKGDLSLTLKLPQLLLDQMSASGTAFPAEAQLDLRLVDGIGYINFDSLKPIMDAAQPGLSQQFKGWGGLDLVTLITQALAENPEALSQMTEGATASMDPEAMAMLSSLQNSVNITRVGEADGAVTFNVALDFAALANNQEFLNYIREQAEAQGEPIDEAEFQKGIAALPALADAVNFSSSQTVESATGFVRSTTFNLAIDSSKLPAEMTQGSTDAPVTMSVSGTINYANFNSAPAITAPEGAQIAPPEMLGMGSN